MKLKQIIGKNIVYYREKDHITQQKLADSSQISLSNLRKIEHGNANLTLDTLERISEGLQIHPSELLKNH